MWSRFPLRLLLLLVALLAACVRPTPPPALGNPAAAVTAAEVLEGLTATAGARALVSQVLASLPISRPIAAWLDSPDGCTVVELVRAHAQSALDGIRAAQLGEPVLPGGASDRRACGTFGDTRRPIDPASMLVVRGAVDLVEGSLLLADVDGRDPHGWAYTCASFELARELAPEWLREFGPLPSDGVLTWAPRAVDAASCTATVRARAELLLLGEGW